jgi:hypothetical protein
MQPLVHAVRKGYGKQAFGEYCDFHSPYFRALPEKTLSLILHSRFLLLFLQGNNIQ